MQIIGQGGVKAHYGQGTLLLTPERRVRQLLEPRRIQASPLTTLYFYASISENGEDVNVAEGLVIFPGEAHDVGPAGVGTAAFAVNGFTPNKTGFIYYEIPVLEDQDIIDGDNLVNSNVFSVGSGSYVFALTARTYITSAAPDPLFPDGKMLWAENMPAAESGIFRHIIARVSVDGGGFPYNLQQLHMGALFTSSAEIMVRIRPSATVV